MGVVVAQLFLGASAAFKAKLTADVSKGLVAAFEAKAFAGFEATVKGSCEFSYDGNTIAKVDASAAVKFGIGAEFEAKLEAPIFGPTKMSLAAGVTVGLGASAKVSAEIDFDEKWSGESRSIDGFTDLVLGTVKNCVFRLPCDARTRVVPPGISGDCLNRLKFDLKLNSISAASYVRGLFVSSNHFVFRA